MAIPTYLANNFNFLETAGVTDFSTTITRMISQALAMGWTNPSGNIIQSPTNAVGQYINLSFVRISATNLEMVFTDSLGRTFTRRTQFSASYTERLYFNTYGMALDSSNGEGLWASLLDLSPELQNSHDQFCTGHAARATDNTLSGNFQTDGHMQLSSGSPRTYSGVAVSFLIPRGNLLSTTPTAGMQSFSQQGSRLWYPVIPVGPVTGTIWRIRGRVFQMLMLSESEAAQSEIVVPIDGATTGTFKILSFPNGGLASRCRWAMRKA